MKKYLILFSCTLIVLVFASCNKTAKFDETLKSGCYYATLTAEGSRLMVGNTVSVWNKAIFDHEDGHGRYVSDFNEALRTLYKDYKTSGALDSISLYKHNLDSIAGEMVNPPSDRKDAYDDFIAMVTEINSLYRMATEPDGSLQNYARNASEQLDKVRKSIDEYGMKYSKIIKKKDNENTSK